MVGLTVGVTLPLLSSAGSAGRSPNAGWSPTSRALQKWIMREQRHPERHPPMPDGRFSKISADRFAVRAPSTRPPDPHCSLEEPAWKVTLP